MAQKKVAIIGGGYVGKAYLKVFPDAIVYDPHQEFVQLEDGRSYKTATKDEVNACDMALVAVPTNPLENGALDMSIVDEVVGWLNTPLILIKSALMPGTVDRLVAGTGKRIAVSVETVGEGKYPVPFWRYPHPTDPSIHSFIIVGGEEGAATEAAQILWQRMSPDTNIHIVSAVEAEICKLMENSWGAMKVSFANEMARICEAYGANYTKVLQAWGADGRVEKMHMRVVPWNKGWKSKCYDKDIPAIVCAAKQRGVRAGIMEAVVEQNQVHLNS